LPSPSSWFPSPPAAGWASVASERSRTQVALGSRDAAADWRCGNMASEGCNLQRRSLAC
jgi:hypothetical protein